MGHSHPDATYGKDGKKEEQLEFSRPARATVDVDPLAKLKTDAKKAKINAIWEQLNAKDAALSSKAGRVTAVPLAGGAPKPANVTTGWMKNLGMVPKRPASVENGAEDVRLVEIQDTEVGLRMEQNADAEQIRKAEARKVASAALAAAKAAAKTATDGKLEINEVREFAGEEVRVTKFVDPNSKEALAVRRKAEMQAASSSGLDALLEQISKKQKLNILDKSRKDWGEFKEEKGIENELDMHIKSGDKYTDKIAFLQRADLREYEKERDARLAVLSRRRSESAPVD